jgi:type II restriction enzyme
MSTIPLNLDGQDLRLTPGAHSALINAVLEGFIPHFAPGAEVLHIDAHGSERVHWSQNSPQQWTLDLEAQRKLPDMILYSADRQRLFLIDTAANRGPINARRHAELEQVFSQAPAEVVYFTAFPSRHGAADQLVEIDWETNAWFADEPEHHIYFNGDVLLVSD